MAAFWGAETRRAGNRSFLFGDWLAASWGEGIVPIPEVSRTEGNFCQYINISVQRLILILHSTFTPGNVWRIDHMFCWQAPCNLYYVSLPCVYTGLVDIMTLEKKLCKRN